VYANNPKANVVFATNWSEVTLGNMNLSSKELLLAMPRIVYVLMSPWGPENQCNQVKGGVPSRQGSDLSAFFGSSMLSDVLGVGSTLDSACKKIVVQAV
jgi:hypothetical protein